MSRLAHCAEFYDRCGYLRRSAIFCQHFEYVLFTQLVPHMQSSESSSSRLTKEHVLFFNEDWSMAQTNFYPLPRDCPAQKNAEECQLELNHR
jgi:hypothetical protein